MINKTYRALQKPLWDLSFKILLISERCPA